MVTNGLEGAIAIVGMSCRFPGARNAAEFWDNLRNGVESIRTLDDDALEAPQLGPDPRRAADYVKAAAVLDGVDLFDAGFFGYSPLEASLMDPQQRLLLECAWEAFEDAGYDPDRYAGAVGVFVGSRTNTYLLNLVCNRQTVRDIDAVEIGLGNDLGFLATRVSYKLNLRGPSCAVQTACSTSLVAVHMACESLLVGESDMAVAGGVTVQVPHYAGYLHRPGAMTSPDAHCRAFSADAAGTVFGSGVGLVVLKRYQDAVADNDTIHALVRGTAINNDGGRKASFTAPAVDGQAALVLDALANAGVTADTIGYVEAHGTGTPLGDPIEIRALTRAFRTTTERRQFCPIGSVKTNIGHLDAAAGIASVIKTALMLEHREIPPSLHCEQPSPHIDFASTPFYVNTRLAEWEGSMPRRAGVSSFGVGGTNAHAVLEEAPARPEPARRSDSHLLVLSARTRRALKQRAAALADHLARVPARLEDVAYTLACGRRHFSERWSIVSRSQSDAVRALTEFAAAPVEPADEVDSRGVVFLFPGQGAQFPGMGAAIYDVQPVFREQVDRCASVLDPLLDCDLRALMFGRAAGHVAEALNETRLAQAALFTIELALARLWMHWGVKPRAMLGHSIGEYVAACLAGVLSQEDALRLVALRGTLMQRMPAGAMLAVALSRAEIEPLMLEDVDLAAVNAAASCVVSGSHRAIAAVESRLASLAVASQRLAVSHAFHSRAMDGVLDDLTAAVARIARQRPVIPYISNVTGTWMADADIDDPAYWSRHVRGTVRFAEGLAELVADRPQVFLEVGPGSTLTGLCRRAADGSRSRHVALASLGGSDDHDHGLEALERTLGRVWEARAECEWTRVNDHVSRRRVPLPTYPFERRRHWIEPDRDLETAATAGRTADERDWYYTPSWRSAEPAGESARPGTILVFRDSGGLADAVTARLGATAGAADIVLVRAGDTFARAGASEYVLDPGRPEHYDALFQACLENHPAPVTHVAHCWSLSGGTAPLADRLASARVGAFGSLVSIARAWASRMRSAPLSIAVVTDAVHDVTRDEMLNPEQALAIGPCRVIPQEMPNLRCRQVDVALGSGAAARTLAAEQIARELLAGGDHAVVCYRSRRRWVQGFERRVLDRPRNEMYRDGGVYLITGGLGGVGAIVAEHLARSVAAKLVLMSRTSLPPRAMWPEAAAVDPNPDVRARLERILRIERAGGTALPIAGDAANPADLAAALAEAKRHFGGVHGVFHAAAVSGGGLVQRKTTAQADAVLRPKVDGVSAIDEVFRSEPLDFLVLFSSVSALLGEFGQVDYCAANAFLDAYGRAASVRDRRVVAVNWDTWRDDGMSRAALGNEALPAAARARIESELRDGLSSAEGCRALDAILASSLDGQVIVSTRPVERRMADVKSVAAALVGGAADGAVAAAIAPGTAPRPAGSATTEAVARTMAAVLGLPAVGPTDDFFDLGGHSLLATRLIARLGEELGVEISLRVFLEGPTVADLSAHVDAMLGQDATPAAAAAESEPVAGPRG